MKPSALIIVALLTAALPGLTPACSESTIVTPARVSQRDPGHERIHSGICREGDRFLLCWRPTPRPATELVCRPLADGQTQGSGCQLQVGAGSGFGYSCATPSYSSRFGHGGPGPHGLRSYTVTFTNGHQVACFFRPAT